MANKIILVGRLTKDPVSETTNSGISYCRFNVACKSKQRNENGEQKVDFFVCVAWRQTAELIAKYCKKGSLLQLSGTMGSRNYEKQDGSKQTIWEVNIEDIEFLSSSGENGDKEKTETKEQAKMEQVDDDSLPF